MTRHCDHVISYTIATETPALEAEWKTEFGSHRTKATSTNLTDLVQTTQRQETVDVTRVKLNGVVSMQRNGKGKFLEVWMESVGGELVIADTGDHSNMLARLDLSHAFTKQPKSKRKGYPHLFRAIMITPTYSCLHHFILDSWYWVFSGRGFHKLQGCIRKPYTFLSVFLDIRRSKDARALAPIV